MADDATLLRDYIGLTCRSVDRIFLQANAVRPGVDSIGLSTTSLRRNARQPET